jgi:hypothetical protein
MIVVLLFVWGGFALFVTVAVRRERAKETTAGGSGSDGSD